MNKQNKIPSIEILFKKQNPQDGELPPWAKKLAIYYTKLHVKAALDAAANNSKKMSSSSNAILNCYPETLIK